MGGSVRIIGLGPGQEDLLTLRALRALEASEVVFVPMASPQAKSRALRIVKPLLSPAQEVRSLVFPMVADEAAMAGYGESAAKALIEEAQNGKDIAFVCVGDPMLYGTGARILPSLKRAGLKIEVIPGVSSISLAAADALVPLALGHESLTVFPLAYGVEDLKTLLKTCSSVVLIKPSRYLKEALSMAKSSNREVYRFSEGRLERLEGEPKENYFSLYIVLPPSKTPRKSP